MNLTRKKLLKIIEEEFDATLEEQPARAGKLMKPTPDQVKEIEQVVKIFPKTAVGKQTINKVLSDPSVQQQLEQFASALKTKTRQMAEEDMVTGKDSTEDPAMIGSGMASGAIGTPLIAALVGLPGYTALAAKIGYLAAPMGYLGATMVGGIAVGALLAYLASKKGSQGN